MIVGSGDPVTVAAHGLGSTVAETRPLLSGVPGTRVFYEARGHGAAAPGASYADLADDLLRVAPNATQALGASMGASTVLRVLSEQPDRYARVVLFLPAAIDAPRTDVRRPTTPEEAEAWVRAEVPTGAPDSWVTERVTLLTSPGVQALAAGIAADVPVRSRASLGAVTADVLVLAQEGDPVHPASVARELVGLLPKARLHVFDRPGALVHSRRELRDLVVGHLS